MNKGLVDQCGGVLWGVERGHGDAVVFVLTRAEAVGVELVALDVAEHARDLTAQSAVRVPPMIMEALAVDVGAARKEGKEADHGKLLN